MKLDKLLEMDMGALVDWLIDNQNEYMLVKKPQRVDSPEDIGAVGEDILIWDGCEWEIDYVDVCPNYGTYYLANGNCVEAWMELPDMM